MSRSSLRAALIALDLEGAVKTRGGSGIFVKPRGTGAAAARRVQAVSPFDVIRTRAYLEPEIAVQAVRHAADARIATGLGRLDKRRGSKVAIRN